MAESGSFAQHYSNLHEEELLSLWKNNLVPEARAALAAELEARQLSKPPLPPLDSEDEGISQQPERPGARLRWWKWLKFYGAVAPLVFLNVLHNAKYATGALWYVLASAVGYGLAVTWILFTQNKTEPWSKGATLSSFVVVHAFVIGMLLTVTRVLWQVGHR